MAVDVRGTLVETLDGTLDWTKYIYFVLQVLNTTPTAKRLAFTWPNGWDHLFPNSDPYDLAPGEGERNICRVVRESLTGDEWIHVKITEVHAGIEDMTGAGGVDYRGH